MKQFIVLDHFLNKKDIDITSTNLTEFDCIVPQKTTFKFTKDLKINENDICILRDSITKKIEYLGIIDTIEKDEITTVETLPFISICDNELKVETLNAVVDEYTVQEWIQNQIENNFINTDDILNKYAIEVRDLTEEEIYYKAVDDSSNLLDVLNEVFLNTGLKIDFEVNYSEGKINKIYCDIKNVNELNIKKIRFDNPQIVDKVKYKYSQYGNFSKATIKVGDTERYFEFYLREDNKITTNPTDEKRIKKVKNKNVTLTAEYTTEDELAEALVLMAQKTLCGDAFAYSIEFNVIINDYNDWVLGQRCDFYGSDRLFEAYVTNVKIINEKEMQITLGAYRYTLTDKFKNLMRTKKEIGNTFNGISISDALGKTPFWFTQENGNLYLNYPDDEEEPNFYIEDGDLYYEYTTSEPDFIVEENELVYRY